MDSKQYADEIGKTGFVLENRVAQILKVAGWSVISNRYYIDDLEESVREIDVVAYRVGKHMDFDIYTVLIISCKKSEQNAWTLLARDINVKDPNSNWWPMHAWSNDHAIKYEISLPGAAKAYYETNADIAPGAFRMPPFEVFAFQEMSRANGKPQNDKAIFGAVTSLMKAQAYELGALPARKKQPCVYQFNLLSVVDADLVRLHFHPGGITPFEFQDALYLARYIVNKRETSAWIRFVHADAFESCLSEYGALHLSNVDWFSVQHERFYDGILEHRARVVALQEQFRKALWFAELRAQLDLGISVDLSSVSVYKHRTGKPVVWITKDHSLLGQLRGSEDFVAEVGSALKKVYRYEGEFELSAAPF